jgi:hypothetical protein
MVRIVPPLMATGPGRDAIEGRQNAAMTPAPSGLRRPTAAWVKRHASPPVAVPFESENAEAAVDEDLFDQASALRTAEIMTSASFRRCRYGATPGSRRR